MLLLLYLALKIVDSTQELPLCLNRLILTEPERVHLDLLELKVALATIVWAYE